MGHTLSGRPPPTVPSCQLSPPFVTSPRKVARGWLTSPPLLHFFFFLFPDYSPSFALFSPFLHPSSGKGLLGSSGLSHFSGSYLRSFIPLLTFY